MSPKPRWIFYQPVFYDHSAAKFDWSTTIWCTIYDVSKPRHSRSVLHMKCPRLHEGSKPRTRSLFSLVIIVVIHGSVGEHFLVRWTLWWNEFLIDFWLTKNHLKRTKFTSITESWMVPLKSTSIGVLLFVILTDVPEVKKNGILKTKQHTIFYSTNTNYSLYVAGSVEGEKVVCER